MEKEMKERLDRLEALAEEKVRLGKEADAMLKQIVAHLGVAAEPAHRKAAPKATDVASDQRHPYGQNQSTALYEPSTEYVPHPEKRGKGE